MINAFLLIQKGMTDSQNPQTIIKSIQSSFRPERNNPVKIL